MIRHVSLDNSIPCSREKFAVKRTAALATFLVFGATCACDSNRTTTVASRALPSPTRPSPTASKSTHPLNVGQEVAGTMDIHGAVDDYVLTAPSDGTLVIRLSWSMAQGRLELWLGRKIASQNESPILAKLAIRSGGQYRLTVADAAPWDYDDFHLDYVMTTALE
jgi:hypothetical protein